MNDASPRFAARVSCLLALLVTLLAASGSGTVASDGGRQPDGQGGGPLVFENVPHPTEEQREAIWTEIRRNVGRLRGQGAFGAEALAAGVTLAWPLRAANGLAGSGYYGNGAFVDHDPNFPGWLRDYDCGTRTYDTYFGYNHRGTDIFTWPFAWLWMENDQVQVVAAAPGTIVYRQDGHPDRSCGPNFDDWNAVFVRHADGSIAWYGHLKKGSLTPKTVGATVQTGEYLGVVGSSGNSTWPHLHFELYDASGYLNDPYQGPCNSLNASSWWAEQRPYYDSAINRIATGFAAPSVNVCPQVESPNERTYFHRGDAIFFIAYYRDELSVHLSRFRVRGPDGFVYASWNHVSPQLHYAASYWYYYINGFDPSGPDGVWTFEVEYLGGVHRKTFVLGTRPVDRLPGVSPVH